jgi:hypothetical protein
MQLNPVTTAALSELPQMNGKCYVNEFTASGWLKVIGELVVFMRECLPEKSCPTKMSLDQTNWALIALQDILSHPPVKQLFVSCRLATPFQRQQQVDNGGFGISITSMVGLLTYHCQSLVVMTWTARNLLTRDYQILMMMMMMMIVSLTQLTLALRMLSSSLFMLCRYHGISS